MAGYSEGKDSNISYTVRNIGRMVLDPEDYRDSGSVVPKEALTQMGYAAAEGLAERAGRVYPAISLVSGVIDSVREHNEALQSQKEYAAGIAHLAEKNVAGFAAHTMTTGGETYTIAVDATNILSESNAAPYISVIRSEPNGTDLLDPETRPSTLLTERDILSNPALKNAIAATANKATSSAHEFSQTFETNLDQHKQVFLDQMAKWLESYKAAKTSEEIKELGIPPQQITPERLIAEQVYDARDKLSDNIFATEPTPSATAPALAATTKP